MGRFSFRFSHIFLLIGVWGTLVPLVACSPEPRSHSTNSLVPILSELLRTDTNPDSRRTAALSLGKIADSKGIPSLTASLKDQDSIVREYSAWALGQIDTILPHEATLALIMALGDSSPAVKEAAASAFGNVEPQEEFSKVLQQVFTVSETSTKLAVVQALSQLELATSYPVFLEALNDSNPRVRQASLSGLGELANPQALTVFRKHLLDDPDEGVRVEAAFRLGKLGGSQDIPVLKKALKTDSTPNVYLWASWALKELSSDPQS